MALQLVMETPSGIMVRYHRIVDLQVNYKDLIVVGTVGSYVDLPSRNLNKLPVELTGFMYKFDSFDATNDIRVEVYTKLANSLFIGATNI